MGKRGLRRLKGKEEGFFGGLKSFCYSHPLVILTLMMVITAGFVFFRFLLKKDLFIFGDIGCDTKDVYHPFFTSLSRKLANGDFSMWDFHYGFGANIISRQADIGSVFTWIIALGGQEWIQYTILLVHIAKIFISGYICYFYLDTFKFSPFSKVVVSYIFAFNGFTLLWGQHYFFGTACLNTIFVLFAIEKALKDKRFYLLVVFATFFVMCNSYYFAYMSLIFAAVYSLFRLAYMYKIKEIKKIIAILFSLLGSVVLGAVMSAFIFIPSIVNVLENSTRFITNASLIERVLFAVPYDKNMYATIISRLFSNNLIGAHDYMGALNYYEAPQFFFTSFILFFLSLFCIDTVISKDKLKIKIIKLLSVALGAFLCLSPILSVVLNGFTAPFARYTFLLMPAFALLFCVMLDKMLKGELLYGKLQIFISLFFSISVLAAAIFFRPHSSVSARFLGLALLVMTAVLGSLLLCMQDSKLTFIGRSVCAVAIALVIMANVNLESFITNNNRVTANEAYPEFTEQGGNDDVAAALEYINKNDKSFFRVDKNFMDTSLLNDGMLQGYYPASTYNSVVNRNVADFAEAMCPDFKWMDGYFNFEYIYRDSKAASVMGVKYIISYEEIFDIDEYKLIDTFGNVYLYENTACGGIARLYGEAYDTEKTLNGEETVIPGEKLLIEGLGEKSELSGGKGTVSFMKPKNSSVVKGEVSSEGDSYLYVAIPYENGWKAYVDGKPVKLMKANCAFSAIEIKDGEQRVEFRYATPMLKEGIIVSVAGFAAFAVWIALMIIAGRKGKSKKANKTQN